jgi:threonine dehydrogenase-like Zn-dependent dehydrogenase
VRALLCRSPRELSLVERPAPIATPGAPLVRIRRAGVCGTDLHIFEGTQPYFEYPRVIGHELGGEIAAIESLPRRPTGHGPSLCRLRPLRRLSARQAELLPADERHRRPQ